jgi:hypothetical protein
VAGTWLKVSDKEEGERGAVELGYLCSFHDEWRQMAHEADCGADFESSHPRHQLPSEVILGTRAPECCIKHGQ